MQSRNNAHRSVDIAKGDHNCSVTHGVGQSLTMFGSDHHVDSETSGGVDKRRGPVSSGGQQ